MFSQSVIKLINKLEKSLSLIKKNDNAAFEISGTKCNLFDNERFLKHIVVITNLNRYTKHINISHTKYLRGTCNNVKKLITDKYTSNYQCEVYHHGLIYVNTYNLNYSIEAA